MTSKKAWKLRPGNLLREGNSFLIVVEIDGSTVYLRYLQKGQMQIFTHPANQYETNWEDTERVA